ncbi:NAD-dependent epimerase/dehydratase family protein [Streptomyces sp. NPDC002265]|uniref:NAD(P)-dependent oxidoreductase n=1 Tax=Streptomyces sp. NPDC002265 TaxID=3154415 RepID=UPI0033280D4B
MTIAVFGATGMVGGRVVIEARTRGHRVLALSRKPASDTRGAAPADPGVTPLAVDVTDATAVHRTLAAAAGRRSPVGADVSTDGAVSREAAPSADSLTVGPARSGGRAGALDAVVLAVRRYPADRAFLVDATRTVLDVAARLGARVLVVGGAGALRSPGDPELPVAENPAYVPAEHRAVAAAGIAQLDACRVHLEADWVYLSPPALLAPGTRTARYRRGTDTLLTGADGRSYASAEDLAAAVLDELEPPGPERHFTIAERPDNA